MGPLRIVLLARPGAGKSTQARRLAGALGAAHLSTGDLLRAAVASGSALGRSVAAALRHGDLVPDELVARALWPQLEEAAAAGGYVLDGFPRDLAQARALAADEPVRPQRAVSVEVSAAECRRRLLARAALEGRADDTPETIDRRLAVYDQRMAPVLDWYNQAGALTRVDGEGDPDQVARRIAAALA